MKLLAREPGRIVLHLTARDRNSLSGLLRMGAACKRQPPRFTRGPTGLVPSDAAELLAQSIAEHRTVVRDGVLGWLEDPARCVPGKGGFGLTLTEAEAEMLLQALTGAKVAFWETLGCPDFESPPWKELTPAIEALLYSMELASAYIALLVEILSGEV